MTALNKVRIAILIPVWLMMVEGVTMAVWMWFRRPAAFGGWEIPNAAGLRAFTPWSLLLWERMVSPSERLVIWGAEGLAVLYLILATARVIWSAYKERERLQHEIMPEWFGGEDQVRKLGKLRKAP